MREVRTILEVLRERGRRGLPLQQIYRLLYNPALYLHAYGKIYRNHGALTPGVTEETADGMSLEKIHAIIDRLRHRSYQWNPTRRTYIPKKNSDKQRPLGLPSCSDKLLQEVIRLLLEAYYEPQFNDHSHGFRPGRGCHTALREIDRTWKGTVWFIEGDISRCFDTLDHQFLMSLLKEKIHDSHFLRLIENLLQAGHLEEWRHHATLSGTPQGGIVSPILANIYLDRLDQYVEGTLLPPFQQGKRRQPNPEYARLIDRAWKRERKGAGEAAKTLRQQAQKLPSKDTHDPEFRRLRYVRYADDFLLSFVGPRGEAEEIKQQLGGFLGETLKLELSPEKTVITHARSQAARFLGYNLTTHHNDQKQTTSHGHRRCVNGDMGLRVPPEVIRKKCQLYEQHGKPIHRRERVHESDYTIVASYQAEYRGVVEYYQMAHNLRTFGRLKWVMGQSLAKTLASKHKTRVNAVWKRYGTTLATKHGAQAGLQVVVQRSEGKKPLVAQWGGISLRRETAAVLNDEPVTIWNNHRSELVERLLAETCELCGSQEEAQVHHIRALKDLKKQGRREKPEWVKRMAARHRKTLVVCRKCHETIHAGRLQRHNRRE